MKFCKDCKHSDKDFMMLYCLHPELLHPVDGKSIPCDRLRHIGWPCQHWEAKDE